MNSILKNIEIAWPYLGPFVAAFLTYFIAVKTKRTDLSIEKKQKLNIVLSNLLESWKYLIRLERLYELTKSELLIPTEIVPHIILNSGMLDDKCFSDLEESLVLLKEYDPIIYYKLNGIGKTFDFLRTNFIFPFLNSTNKTRYGNKISEENIYEIKNDIKVYLKLISKSLDYRTSINIKKVLKEDFAIEINDLTDELYNFYYELMMSFIPDGFPTPTYEDFLNELSSKAYQKEEIDALKKFKLNDIMNLVAQDPHITVVELTEKLSKNNS